MIILGHNLLRFICVMFVGMIYIYPVMFYLYAVTVIHDACCCVATWLAVCTSAGVVRVVY